MIVVLLLLILIVLCFGPLAGMITAMAGALGVAVWALICLLPFVLIGLFWAGAAICWLVWLVINPKAALAGAREAQEDKKDRQRLHDAVRKR